MQTNRFLCGAAALLLSTSLATGQDARANFWAYPLAGNQPITIEFEYQGAKIIIKCQGPNVTVREDNKKIGTERLLRTGNQFKLKGDDGSTIAKVQLGNQPWAQRTNRFFYPGMANKTRAAMGVTVAPVPAAIAAHLDLKPNSAVIVQRTNGGQAASRAGIRQHDIIIALDGEQPVTKASLSKFLASKKPGEEVTVEFLRKGSARSASVVLDEIKTPIAWGAQTLPGYTKRLPTLFDPKVKSKPQMWIYDQYRKDALPGYASTFSKAAKGVDSDTQSELRRIRAELQKLQKQLDRVLKKEVKVAPGVRSAFGVERLETVPGKKAPNSVFGVKRSKTVPGKKAPNSVFGVKRSKTAPGVKRDV